MMDKQFTIGHYTDVNNITGCSVILCPPDTVASCYISGSAPGSREIALLSPERKIQTIHAVLLTGGSAFGLNAAAGVMTFLEEKGYGYVTGFGVVPIVPAAVIYDLNIGNASVRPLAENAYQACTEASDNFNSQGCIGVGTGATIGKWAGITNAMKGGLGTATVTMDKIKVTAVSVVNSVGDVIDETGKVIAGALDQNGQLIAETDLTKRWQIPQVGFAQNTVLAVIMTNARLSKLETYIVSKRAQHGLARAIIPASTSYDGDVIFTLARGNETADMDLIGEMGAEALRRSIISGTKSAVNLGKHPAYRDLKK
jgi:L-aminopeptidase/D-esterase-like protein